LLDQFFHLGFSRMVDARMRVIDHSAHHGDTLDNLGNCLDEQQEKAGRNEKFCRPLC
jgi:hypothetical protein